MASAENEAFQNCLMVLVSQGLEMGLGLCEMLDGSLLVFLQLYLLSGNKMDETLAHLSGHLDRLSDRQPPTIN